MQKIQELHWVTNFTVKKNHIYIYIRPRYIYIYYITYIYIYTYIYWYIPIILKLWGYTISSSHRIDCPLGRKPGGSTRAEEKPLRDTACRLRGKGLDMSCDSYWGWLSWFYRTLSHFVSFKNRNHWPQFESCLESSSDHSAICIKLDFVESEKVFSTKVIHAEPIFPCDYVRNGYCKRIITSTAECKRVF